MVFQQQKSLGVLLPLRHVTFARANRGQQRHAFGQRTCRRQSLAVGLFGLRLTHLDQALQRCVAQLRAHSLDQPQRQFRVRIGKAAMAGGGEMPKLGRPTNAAPFGLGRDQAISGEPDELLSRRFGRDVQYCRQIGDALRPAPFDRPEQPVCR
jgi:hypothetical protein